MDLKITIPAIVGVLGFALSIYNLWRAMLASREVRSIAYAQRKQELLAQVIAGEAAYMSAKVVAQDLRDEATDSGVSEGRLAVDQANSAIDACDGSLKLLEETRNALEATDARTKSHEDLVFLIEEYSDRVRTVADKSKIEAEIALLLQPAKRLMRLIHTAQNRAARGAATQ